MCLAIPGQVISIDQKATPVTARVNFSGIIREVIVEWVENVTINDYVIVHAGFAISKLNEQQAMATLQLFHQKNK